MTDREIAGIAFAGTLALLAGSIGILTIILGEYDHAARVSYLKHRFYIAFWIDATAIALSAVVAGTAIARLLGRNVHILWIVGPLGALIVAMVLAVLATSWLTVF